MANNATNKLDQPNKLLAQQPQGPALGTATPRRMELAVTKLALPAPAAKVDFYTARNHARSRPRRQVFTCRVVQGEFTWIAGPGGDRPKRNFEPAVNPGSSKIRLPMKHNP